MPSDEKDPLHSLIAEILEAENRGESVDRDAMLNEYPELADSLRDFFTDHDRMKDAADQEDPTLPPDGSGIDAPTIPPNQDEATMPPRLAGEDPTLPPTQPASTDGPVVGDQVRYFGDYELLEEIARGGMGVVFKARQINLNRIVALKMILSGELAGKEEVQRFKSEAESAARLDHPGIVPIFEIGEISGQHYFSMGFVEGESLADRLSDGPLPPREAAELMVKISQAVAYAHDKGVIHRDLKPANVLIDKDGMPRVTDFGLAKKVEGDSELTRTGQIIGTPAYMPPEQASGRLDEVGPLADVYSLGAMLYALLTGRPPFQAASPLDTLMQIIEREPLQPRSLNPAIDFDLETICLKAMRKESRDRYLSTNELTADLKRFLAGEPIQARPVGVYERLMKWSAREPLAWALLVMIPLFLMGNNVAAATIGGAVLGLQLRLRTARDFFTRWLVFSIVSAAVADVTMRLYGYDLSLSQVVFDGLLIALLIILPVVLFNALRSQPLPLLHGYPKVFPGVFVGCLLAAIATQIMNIKIHEVFGTSNFSFYAYDAAVRSNYATRMVIFFVVVGGAGVLLRELIRKLTDRWGIFRASSDPAGDNRCYHHDDSGPGLSSLLFLLPCSWSLRNHTEVADRRTL